MIAMLKELLGIARRRLISAFLYSLEGFGAAWRSEEAIKVEIALLPVLVIAAIYVGKSRLEQALMISSLILVVIVELLNTAIEKTIDRISTEQNQLSKKVKDMGSAAVLGAIVHAVVVWGLLLA
jgi:diacylglycerol kinase (ATP)